MDAELEQVVRALVERLRGEVLRAAAPPPAPPEPELPPLPYTAEAWIARAADRTERSRRAFYAARHPGRFAPAVRRPVPGLARPAGAGRGKAPASSRARRRKAGAPA